MTDTIASAAGGAGTASRLFLKAAINGGISREEHPQVPIAADEIGRAAAEALAAGADIVHAHARRDDGGETIEPEVVAAMVAAVRAAAPGASIGTTTGLWTVVDHAERLRLVSAWDAGMLPDFASSAYSEEGADEVAMLILERGMRLESAVWEMKDVDALLASEVLERNDRILIEPLDNDPAAALRNCRDMAARIRAEGVELPLLYHGYDDSAWPLVQAAVEDGAQMRIGFEDIVRMPSGELAASNADLVREARRLERG